jgi:hypothetical protein
MIMNRSIAIPKEWVTVQIPSVDAKLYDGARIQIPAYAMDVALRYPVDDKGELIANLKQREVAQFLREYNKANGTNFKLIPLYADEAIRDKLGKEHVMFDENFERNRMPWRWGYFADFTRQTNLGTVEGIDGQQLITRELCYRMLLGGDEKLGIITIAPSGMVPRLTREQLEKRIGAKGLKRLEQLRGREIHEKGEQIVDVRNALGYPQFTLGDDAIDDNGFVSHSHHVYAPDQSEGETVGARCAFGHRDGRGCFDIRLDVGPGGSGSCRSFPLVRGEEVKGKVTKQSYSISL